MDRRLGKVPVPFSQDKSCVGVCVVSGGYPGSYPKGKTITGVCVCLACCGVMGEWLVGVSGL